VTAERDRVREETAVGNAGLHHGRIEAVGAHVLLVEYDQPLVRAEQGEPVRHVADRAVEPLHLDTQLRFQPVLRGRVLVDRDPAAVGQRLVAHRHDEAGRQFAATGERFSALQQLAALAPERLVPVRQSGPDHLRRQVENLEVAPVEQGDAPLGVEHAQPVRHGVERGPVQRQRARPVRRPILGRPVAAPRHVGRLAPGRSLRRNFGKNT